MNTYEVIKNGRPTGILIEAKNEMAASIVYMNLPRDTPQYNTPSIKLSFKLRN
jgi:hypothetical protein